MLRKINKNKAQVTLEFSFCMIIILLMMFSLIRIFRWTGMDLAERRKAHERELGKIVGLVEDYEFPRTGPLKQIDPYFFKPGKLDAVWEGDPNIYNKETR